jgi:hypothetical protein
MIIPSPSAIVCRRHGRFRILTFCLRHERVREYSMANVQQGRPEWNEFVAAWSSRMEQRAARYRAPHCSPRLEDIGSRIPSQVRFSLPSWEE